MLIGLIVLSASRGHLSNMPISQSIRSPSASPYVAEIIEDGATLQVDLGRIPNETLKHLCNRRDLGIHSNVITDPIQDLIEKGVITGRHKTLHPGKIVTSFCIGSRRLYE